MENLLFGLGASAAGLFMFVMGVLYLQGRGIRHAPFGPPVVLVGGGPLFGFIGLAMVWTVLTSNRWQVVATALLVLAGLSALLMFAIGIVKFVFDWPRYGQWPNLLRRRRRSLKSPVQRESR